MKPYLICISLLLFLSCQTPGFAFSDAQFGSIQRLGELNGIALHCRALAETRKMKRALVSSLPKRRQLGELFDLETHNAYLRFFEQRATCPGRADLAQQVDAAIERLRTEFAGD